MTQLQDPYRVLGLPRTASLDEVKRAYRRLAKELHPDSGGERTLARFLEIQAAYEQLVTGRPPRGSGPTGAAGARAPWQADPTRADATRRAYGSRGRRSGSRQGTDPGASSARPGAQRGDQPPPDEGRRRGRRKATLGSTSYDEAADQPFDPDWTGAGWYGTTSGTYWTLNPREYADPRKHGPEYQARARRRATDTSDGVDTDPARPDGSQPDPADASPAGAGPGWRPTAETSAGTEWSASPGTANSPPQATRADAWPGDRRPPSPPSAGADGPAPLVPDLSRLLDPAVPRGPAARLAMALAGGVPVALWLAWLLGEISGCGRFSAACQPELPWLAWIVGFALVIALVLLPGLATVLVMGLLGAVVAAVPATVVLTATGGARMPEESAVVLGVALMLGWLGGVTFATRRWRRESGGAGPVS